MKKVFAVLVWVVLMSIVSFVYTLTFLCIKHINNLHAKLTGPEFFWSFGVIFIITVILAFIESKFVKKEKFMGVI